MLKRESSDANGWLSMDDRHESPRIRIYFGDLRPIAVSSLTLTTPCSFRLGGDSLKSESEFVSSTSPEGAGATLCIPSPSIPGQSTGPAPDPIPLMPPPEALPSVPNLAYNLRSRSCPSASCSSASVLQLPLFAAPIASRRKVRLLEPCPGL